MKVETRTKTEQELEKLLCKNTDTEKYSGDTNPKAPKNLVFNIAWELYQAMRNEEKSVNRKNEKPIVFLSDLGSLKPFDESGKKINYFHEAMRKIGLIDKDNILTKEGIRLYDELNQEKYYEDDGDPW